jgi:hypothetical protein
MPVIAEPDNRGCAKYGEQLAMVMERPVHFHFPHA